MANQFGFKEEFQGSLKNHWYHDHVIGSSLKFNFYLVVIAEREQERGRERDKWLQWRDGLPEDTEGEGSFSVFTEHKPLQP